MESKSNEEGGSLDEVEAVNAIEFGKKCWIVRYMKVNEAGDMFMIDWKYDEYSFAIYGMSPQYTSQRDI